MLPFWHLCSRDLAAAKLALKEGTHREVTLASSYLPYEEAIPTVALRRMVDGLAGKDEIVFSMDANAHHWLWGSTNTYQRGDSLLEYLLGHDLEVLNRGSKATFVNRVRAEVIDITIATRRSAYRNPKLTNWDTYCTQLEEEVKSCLETIRNTWHLECLNTSLTDAIIRSYTDNNRVCRIQTNRNTTWWNEELARLRGPTRRLFNTAKRTGCWDTYKSALTDYNMAVRKGQRGVWRRFCNDVNDAPSTFRINRILCRDSERGVLLLRWKGCSPSLWWEPWRLWHAHTSLGFILIEEKDTTPTIESYTCSRDKWIEANRIVNSGKVDWAIKSFSPFKSASMDLKKAKKALLQKGLMVLKPYLLVLLRGSLALSHIPCS
ncbi:uncharacterized protein [Halyomorpha halys]|uniref:uncharacterized protein n=1 Tax=Halyomorpha halys TaxID=286706 RepID=UPI0006D4F2E8|nr:uncharacterized protein LOC106681350 [Halyomorpha halys]